MSKKTNHTRQNMSLFQAETVERLAKQGFDNFWEAYKQSFDEKTKNAPDFDKKMEIVKHHHEFLYFHAFESALNYFFLEVLEDTMHQVELHLDKFEKLTAEIKENGNKTTTH